MLFREYISRLFEVFPREALNYSSIDELAAKQHSEIRCVFAISPRRLSVQIRRSAALPASIEPYDGLPMNSAG